MSDKKDDKPKKADDHGKRLDKLEKDHADLRDLARANGWSLPE